MENFLKSLVLCVCNTEHNPPWLVTCHASSRNCVCVRVYVCMHMYTLVCVCACMYNHVYVEVRGQSQEPSASEICFSLPPRQQECEHSTVPTFQKQNMSSGCWTQVLMLEKQALYQLPSPGHHPFQITPVTFVRPVPSIWFDYENL